MSPEDVKEMIAMLSTHFGMRRVPHFEMATPVDGLRAISRAWASYDDWMIYFSKRLPIPEYEATTLHEFAHLLAHKERGRIRRGGRRDHHGPHFVDALERVVIAWYGNLADYPWMGEYPTVRKRAGVCQCSGRRGWLSHEPFTRV